MASQDTGSRLLWFLAGTVIGAGIALLYAPQSGRDTRRAVRRKAGEGGQVLSEASRGFLQRSREYYDKGLRIAEEAGELLERGRRHASR